MKFSVIVCTYNQADSLRIVLDGMEKQLFTTGEYELIVVDNNSTDHTRQVCEEAFRRIPYAVKYVFEGRQGLSVARNRGVAEAAGDVVIFTDDDAKLPSNWLQSYCDTYVQFSADAVYGRIWVDWAQGQPSWYSDHFGPMFVRLDYGSAPLIIQDLHHEFFGKNFSVRKRLLLELGGFDEKLGRIGNRLFLGEETRIYRGLISGGYKVVYSPQIQVGHMLKDYEYTEEHCWKHTRDATLSEYYMMQISDSRKVFGRPLYALRKSVSLLGASMKSLMGGGGYSARFHSRVMASKARQLIFLWLKGGGAGQ